MHRSNQPTKTNVRHQIANRAIRFSNCGFVIESHREASRELDQKTNQSYPTQAVKDIYVRWDILRSDIVSYVLNFKTFLEPVIDG